MPSSFTLPNDIEGLQRLVRAQQALLASRELEIEHLKLQLARLRRMQFGRSSEHLDTQIAQLELRLEELETGAAVVTQTASVDTTPTPERRQPVRRPLPEHLPREEIVHAPECACPACGGELTRLGEDVAEVLEYVPARFKVIRHVRPRLACRRCDTIVQAPAPSRPIARGLAGPGLLAHVLVAKYADHLPLYRQSEIYAREGVDLDRSTLADWVGGASALLEPLVEAACWAHVRRKFFDLAEATQSPLAQEALTRIGALYAIEAEIRGQPPSTRSAVRQARAGPLLADLHRWLHATLATLSKKSALAGAIKYALSRWPALVRYRDDGRLEIDNNAAERALRAVALGRKNYLFAGSDAGGERAASIYTLLGTAKLNDLDPELYLRHVLERIADHPINRIDELLPWHVADRLAPPQLRAAA